MKASFNGRGLRWLVGLVVLLTSPAVAQEPVEPAKPRRRREVDLHYNFSLIGHNLSLHYNHFFGRHAVMVGGKFHLRTQINRDNSRLEGLTFYKSADYYSGLGPLRAIKSRSGIDLGYKYALVGPSRAASLNPYAFYQLQITILAKASNQSLSIVGLSGNSWSVLENVVGLGVQPKLRDRWYLNGSVGYGSAYFINESGTFRRPGGSTGKLKFWEQALVIRVGVTYRLAGSE